MSNPQTIYGYHHDGRNLCTACAHATINDVELCRRWEPLTECVVCDECDKVIESMVPKYCESCRDACTQDENLHWNDELGLWICDLCESGKSRA